MNRIIRSGTLAALMAAAAIAIAAPVVGAHPGDTEKNQTNQKGKKDAQKAGRVVLCGDAGTAFLPTAGIGASSALRSAAALADELSRADGRLAPLAIDLYVERTEKVIRGNQTDSRHLARAMFVENGLAIWSRDELLHQMPVTSMTKSILEAMRQPV